MDSPSLEAYNYQLNESLAEKSRGLNIIILMMASIFKFQALWLEQLSFKCLTISSLILYVKNTCHSFVNITKNIVIDHLHVFYNLLFTALLPGRCYFLHFTKGERETWLREIKWFAQVHTIVIVRARCPLISLWYV